MEYQKKQKVLSISSSDTFYTPLKEFIGKFIMSPIKKLYLKRIIAITVFTVLFLTSYLKLSRFFADRQDGGVYQMEAFYAQPQNSIDILFLGSSRIYCNVSPAALWDKYGFSSYDLATSSARIHLSVWALKEAFKTQKPKVVLLDVSRRDHTHQYEDELQTISLQSGMKYSLNSIAALFPMSLPENRPDYLLRLPTDHSRYSIITKEDLIKDTYPHFPLTKAAGHKGEINLTHSTGFSAFSDEMSIDDSTMLPELSESLDEIKETCDRYGAELILINTPHIDRTEFTGIKSYCSQNNTPYLNMNYIENLNKINLDVSTDFADEGHMNMLGSYKTGVFLADYLHDNYQLADHRGDMNYYSYAENSAFYAQTLKNKKLSHETGLGNYFSYLPNDNYITIISMLGDYKSVAAGQKELLARAGINSETYDRGGTCVFHGSELLYYAPNDEHINYTLDIGLRVLSIAPGTDENIPDIAIDDYIFKPVREDNSPVIDGLMIINYDCLSCQTADAVIFDGLNDYMIVR